MKIPFTDKEILTIHADRSKFLMTIGNHTNADNKSFEKIFVGQVHNEGFQVVRVKKFGFWDYCITSLIGLAKDDQGRTELHLTYKLRWWYAIELPLQFLFFGTFVTLAANSDNSDSNGILMIAGLGLVAITLTSLRYKRRYNSDKEKYRTILDQMVVRSNVR
jgi:hypothetical protein